MPVPSSMADLSTTAASNYPTGSDSPTSGDDYFRSIQAIIRSTNAKGADIASATTTDIGAATGEFVDVTGTTTITGLGAIAAGIVRTVRFTGALTLTHNATSLILPGSANITTANGDVAQFRSLGSGNWKCVGYIPQAGYARPGANSDITSLSGLTTPLSVAQGGTGVSNIPAFSAYATSTQFVTSGIFTKVTLGGELFDTNNNFASSRFTPTVAGYYQFNGTIRGEAVDGLIFQLVFYKNGAEYRRGKILNFSTNVNSTPQMSSASELIYCNGTTDYVELYGQITGTSPSFNFAAVTNTSAFSGYLVRAA